MSAPWGDAVDRAVRLTRAGIWLRRMHRAPNVQARDSARRRLAELLGEARGIAMKVGQLSASTAEDDPMRALLCARNARPLEELRPAIEAALGGDLGNVFTRFEESTAAASLGQVHRAALLDGTEVAVKVRYPSIERAVRGELRLAGLVPGVGPVRKWGFDLAGYKRVLHENMMRELDYADEAARQERFGDRVRVSGLVVPRVHRAWCSPSLLVQSWEEGDALEAARGYDQRDRATLGMILLETLFTSLFRAGVVHADPHRGNYLVRSRSAEQPARLVLLDYGCTVQVSEQARLALLHLITRVREGGELDALSAFAALGFDADKLSALAGQLPALSEALFAPFLVDRPFRVDRWQLGSAFDAICGELKWWFRAAGPPELFLLLRAFQGVCQHLLMLDVALPWWPILERSVGEDLVTRARRHRPEEIPTRQMQVRARFLRVRVLQHGVERVALCLPAREALRLEQVMPDEVVVRARRRGIDIGALQRSLRESGLAPGEVFREQGEGGDLRVWLE